MGEIQSHDQGRHARLNLCVAFLAFFYLLGTQTILMPVLYPSIMADMGWSRGEVTSYASLKYLAGGIMAFTAGFLIDRFGLKPVLIGALICKALALTCFAGVDVLASYYTIAMVNGGTGVVAVVALHTLIARWFRQGQGRAHGTALLGSALAGIVLPLLLENLMQQLGWRWTIVSVNLFLGVLLFPILMFTVRDVPPPDPRAAAEEEAGSTLAQLVRRRVFWIALLVLIGVGFAQEGLHQHTKSYIELDLGYSGEFAAAALSAVMLVSIFGRVGFGWLYDRFSVGGLALCYLMLGCSALVALGMSGFISIALFCALRGMSHGGAMVDAPVLLTHLFGRRNLARLLGIVTGASSLGMALSPAFYGFLHDMTGSYRIPFITTVVICAACAITIYRQSAPFRPDPGKTAKLSEPAVTTPELLRQS